MNLTLTLTAEQLAELARQVAPLVQLEPEATESPWLSVAAAAAYLSVSARTSNARSRAGGCARRLSAGAGFFTATI